MTTVTLSKGGTAERMVEAASIAIPDLWHIAQALPKDQREAVLETWHLAHSLRQHAIESQPERDKETEQALSWLCQNGYSHAGPELDKYCEPRGLEWTTEAMYGYVIYRERSEAS